MHKIKRLAIIALCIIPIVATLFTWLNRDTYGDTYSEQQRKHWNEFIALLPSEKYFFAEKPDREASNLDSETKQLTAKRLLENIRHLQQTSAPDWKIQPAHAPDPSLPLDGMTPHELRRYAETNGDPEAYLTLCHTIEYSKSLSKKKNDLQKAADANRPGADFLLRVLEAEPKQSPFLTDKKTTNYIFDLPGYSAFKTLIDAGDFTLYKTLFFLNEDIHSTPIGKELKATLHRKAKQGDAIAQRQLAEYIILPLITGSNWDLANTIEREQGKPSYLISTINKIGKDYISNWKPISDSATSSPTLDELVQASESLKKAAAQGDIRAMALWIRYGTNLYPHFREKDWEDTLLYTNRLIQAGYFPIVKDIWPDIGSLPRSMQIALAYYSPASVKQTSFAIYQALLARNYYQHIASYIQATLTTNTDEENLHLLAELRQLNPEHFCLMMGCLPEESYSKRPENFDYFHNLISRLDNPDGPLEKTAHAHLHYFRALSFPLQAQEELKKAIQLLEQAFSQTVEHNIPIKNISLRTDIMLELIELYSFAGQEPTPENKAQFFTLARQYLTHEDSYSPMAPAIANLLMAIAYNKGYGTSIDNKLAAHHYQQAFEHAGTRYKEELENFANSLNDSFKYSPPKQ